VRSGLVIGKFLPPHRGHRHLVEQALARVDALTVIVFTKRREPIPGDLRAAWVRQYFPEATVLHVREEHPVDFADPAVWDLWIGAIRRAYPSGPTTVFSSETYGEELARRLGATHAMVDPDRRAVPVSGTAIRERPLARWDDIAPCARPWFVRRVAVVGAESTGKTTLAAALAGRFATAWVPEYAREHLAARGGVCRPEDLPVIARRQREAEDRLAAGANRYLFCDTDLLTTALWSERYFGAVDPEVAALAAQREYALTFLCGNDVPWVDDGLRDSPGHREWFLGRFERELGARARPYVSVAGSHEVRLRAAAEAVARGRDGGGAAGSPAGRGGRGA
jgi:NadR type nicotinamide-nucleotide adenylyltransferase